MPRAVLPPDMTPILQTERLLLRRWRGDDLEPFTALNTDPLVMRYFPRLLDHQATADIVGKMEAHHETYGFGYWPIELLGIAPFIGFVGLMITPFQAPFTPCIETAWRLARPFWGQGYAREGAIASLTFAFKHLPAEEVVAFSALGNRRSIGLMKRIGMIRRQEDDFDHPGIPEGDLRRRHCLYRMSRERWSSMTHRDDRIDIIFPSRPN